MSERRTLTDATETDADRLRLDYQQTTDLLRDLTDARFKLLALVPTLSGTAVALIGRPTSSVALLAVGVLGLTATLGVLTYELRNSALYDYALHRACELEGALGFRSIRGTATGGLFTDRPAQRLRLLRLVSVDRERGFALVYGASVAGWTYLVAWGLLHALHASAARGIGAAIGAAVGIVIVADLVHPHRDFSSAQSTGNTPLHTQSLPTN